MQLSVLNKTYLYSVLSFEEESIAGITYPTGGKSELTVVC